MYIISSETRKGYLLPAVAKALNGLFFMRPTARWRHKCMAHRQVDFGASLDTSFGMAEPKKKSDADELFKAAPPHVQKLHAESKKLQREVARKLWWKENSNGR